MGSGFWTRPIRETLSMSSNPVAQNVGDHYNARAQARGVRAVSKSRKKTSHLFHLIMTLLTGGLWGFVWVGIIIWHSVGPRKKTVTRLPGTSKGSDQVTADVYITQKTNNSGA